MKVLHPTAVNASCAISDQQSGRDHAYGFILEMEHSHA